MVNSINTNSPALGGLRALNKSQTSLSETQNKISTGKKINSPKDNAAILNIAQQLIGDFGGLNAAKNSLNRGASISDLAISVAEEAQNRLIELKEKAVAASDEGLDQKSRDALDQEFIAIRQSIRDIISNASFNGTNALEGDDITAIANSDGSQTIKITGQDFSENGPTITFGAGDDISTAANAAATLSKIDASIQNVGSALSELGSGAKSIERQIEFTAKLGDTIEAGVGNLVDANLAQESARLVADQVRQQLGLRTQAIANRAPSSLLSLFQ